MENLYDAVEKEASERYVAMEQLHRTTELMWEAVTDLASPLGTEVADAPRAVDAEKAVREARIVLSNVRRLAMKAAEEWKNAREIQRAVQAMLDTQDNLKGK